MKICQYELSSSPLPSSKHFQKNNCKRNFCIVCLSSESINFTYTNQDVKARVEYIHLFKMKTKDGKTVRNETD